MSDDRTEDGKYVSWARAIKVKNSFTCQVCFKSSTDVYLESHHLNSWDWDIQKRYDINNGVSLCGADSGCRSHKLFHQIFGYGGNHAFQFEQYKKIYNILKNIISSPPPIDSSLNVAEK